MGGGTCSGSNNGSSHGACLARQSLQARHPRRPCTAHRPHMLRARSCSNRCGRDGRAARNTAHHSWVWRAGAWLHNRMHQLVCAPQGTDHQTHTRALPPTGMMGSTAPDRMCSDWWRPPTVHSALGQVSPCTQCVSVYSCLWGGWKGGAQEDGARVKQRKLKGGAAPSHPFVPAAHAPWGLSAPCRSSSPLLNNGFHASGINSSSSSSPEGPGHLRLLVRHQAVALHGTVE